MYDSLQVIKDIKIFGIEHEYHMELRSFVAENNFVYFWTVIRIEGTDSLVLDTAPIPQWILAKGMFNHILQNIEKHLLLSDKELSRLSKPSMPIH